MRSRFHYHTFCKHFPRVNYCYVCYISTLSQNNVICTVRSEDPYKPYKIFKVISNKLSSKYENIFLEVNFRHYMFLRIEKLSPTGSVGLQVCGCKTGIPTKTIHYLRDLHWNAFSLFLHYFSTVLSVSFSECSFSYWLILNKALTMPRVCNVSIMSYHFSSNKQTILRCRGKIIFFAGCCMSRATLWPSKIWLV